MTPTTSKAYAGHDTLPRHAGNVRLDIRGQTSTHGGRSLMNESQKVYSHSVELCIHTVGGNVMTPLQTLEIRAGDIRKRLAVIGGMEELTDEVRSGTGSTPQGVHRLRESADCAEGSG